MFPDLVAGGKQFVPGLENRNGATGFEAGTGAEPTAIGPAVLAIGRLKVAEVVVAAPSEVGWSFDLAEVQSTAGSGSGSGTNLVSTGIQHHIRRFVKVPVVVVVSESAMRVSATMAHLLKERENRYVLEGHCSAEEVGVVCFRRDVQPAVCSCSSLPSPKYLMGLLHCSPVASRVEYASRED